jgi:hypothetical protein
MGLSIEQWLLRLAEHAGIRSQEPQRDSRRAWDCHCREYEACPA